jgi:small-conductance mechanosensitive channel/CRP-like cAMP-binding protein
MTQAILSGIGVFAILELVYVTLRRSGWPVRVRALYHLWAFSLGVVATLTLVLTERELGWRAAASLAAVLTALVGFSLVDSLVFQRPWNPSRGPMMPKLARDVLRVVVLAAAGLVIATAILRQPLPAVLVSSTVLSAVIGLALQDVLKNVFAGMAIELEHPFGRGDWLLLDGETVQVMDTSWRSVRLRTRDGIDLWEPNSTFSGSRVVNYGSGQRPIGMNFRVGVAYDAPPARVRAALLAAARATPGALELPAPEAFVQEYGESAVSYRLRVWTLSLANLSRFRSAVNSRVWYELKREGLTIPFPMRTVQWHDAARVAERAEEANRGSAARLLRETRLFRDLPVEAVDTLAAAADRLHFDDGEILVREGEQGDSLFVIEHGRVSVSTAVVAAESGPLQLAIMEAGSFFGEISLLTGEPRSATVTSEGGCEVLVLSKEAIAPLLEQDPRLAELLAAAVVARQARTAAKLEDRRGRTREGLDERSASSLLQRIRSFFKLPG